MKHHLENQRFGKLVVIQEGEPHYYRNGTNRARTWICKCDCGNTKTIIQTSLLSGNTKSCGCGCEENRRKILMSKGVMLCKNPRNERIARILNGMVQRCTNPNNVEYHRYGGRGITVCDEWRGKVDGYDKFYEWSMSNGYSDVLTIDRIDNDKGYSPDNCRWVDRKTQMRNTSISVHIPYKGKTYSYSGLSEVIGESAHSIAKWHKRGFETGEEIIKAIEKAKIDYPHTVQFYGRKRPNYKRTIHASVPQAKVYMAEKGLEVEL